MKFIRPTTSLKNRYLYVYKITCITNKKVYVGARITNIGVKPEDDKKYLGRGKLIKELVKKLGRKKFKKEILQVCKTTVALEKAEKKWIKRACSLWPKGLNISRGLEIYSHEGHPNSDEIKRKIGEARRRHNKLYGTYSHTEESKRKIRAARKRQDKIRPPCLGYKFTPEQLKRLSESHMGITSGMKGKQHKESSKNKLKRKVSCKKCNKKFGICVVKQHERKCKNKRIKK